MESKTMTNVELKINGIHRSLDVPPLMRLLDVLREHLNLTGTKEGCGEGECGACTVMLDGEPVNACLVPVGQCDGREVVTIEGLEEETRLSSLGASFVDHNGVQCGMCTPGMMVSAHCLLRRNPVPTEAEIRKALAGNICRCTGYAAIVESLSASVPACEASSGAEIMSERGGA